MNATTRQALRPIADRDTLAWIVLVLTAITILVSGALVVRQVNAEQAVQAAQATQSADDGGARRVLPLEQ
jgi:hypothetical protein